ncbi:MAG TPA: hypothetical protein P5081_07860 [Phycisphaerae bacterium]|nr:hypothetical protein [Phycisphaerae bacterium]
MTTRGFDAILDECRQRFRYYGIQKTLLGGERMNVARQFRRDGVGWRRSAALARVAADLQIGWGAMIAADIRLFEPGRGSHPSSCILSFDPYFDTHPDHFLRMADRMSVLRSYAPSDPVLSRFANILNEPSATAPTVRVPWVLSDGYVMWFTRSMIFRRFLPDGVLRCTILPVAAKPGAPSKNVTVPISCWPDELTSRPIRETIDAAHAPAEIRKPITPLQLAEDAREVLQYPRWAPSRGATMSVAPTDAVRLTTRCAARVREVAENSRLPNEWYLRLGGPFEASRLDITQFFDPQLDHLFEYHGVRVVFRKDMPPRVTLTVDHDVSSRSGFRITES